MAVTVKLSTAAPARYPKVSIVAESGFTVTFPYAPNEIDYKNLTPGFDEQERPGRAPLLLRSGDQLIEMSFSAKLCRPDHTSIEDVLAKFVWLMALGERVRVGYDGLSGGLWRITEGAITVTDHEPFTNHVNEGTLQMTLKRASDLAVALTSTAKSRPVTARGGESGTVLKQRTRSQSLGAVADANGVRDFRRVGAGATVRPG